MWHRHKRKDVKNPQFTLVCTLKGLMALRGEKRLEYFECFPQEDRLVRSALHGFHMISGMEWLKDHRFENCQRKGP